MWQRNKGKNFMEEAEAHWNWEGDLSATKSVFHWLRGILEYDPEANRQFNRKRNKEWSTESGYACIYAWLEYVEERFEAGGIYGEGKPLVENTYNGNDAGSQTLQFGFYTRDNEEYIVLTIHGGADIRGGYTEPVIFKSNGCADLGIFDAARLSADCSNCEEGHYYSDDAGYHWYHGNSGTDLTDLELVVIESGRDHAQKENDEPTKVYQQTDENGKIVVFCPYCGGDLNVGN